MTPARIDLGRAGGLVNRTIIGTLSLAWFLLDEAQATPLRAGMVPKHVRCQLLHTPRRFVLRDHT